MTKPHFSPSQLGLAGKCLEAYRRRYIEGEKIPPGIALLKGSGFHGGAEANMLQKVESHVDLPASQIIESAVAAFEGKLQADGVLLDEQEQGVGVATVVAEAKDDLVDLVAVHAREQAPNYQPVFVEQEVTIELPGTHDLMGIIDLADDRARIVDFKTAKRGQPDGTADKSVQLTTYAAAYKALTGDEPALVMLDTVVQTKTKTYRQVQESTRGPEDLDALAHRINALGHAVEVGSFPPTSPDNWMCSPKWCGFYATCRFVQGAARKAQGD